MGGLGGLGFLTVLFGAVPLVTGTEPAPSRGSINNY